MLNQGGSTSFWATFWAAIGALATVGILMWTVYDGKQDNTTVTSKQREPVTAKRKISRIPSSTAETH